MSGTRLSSTSPDQGTAVAQIDSLYAVQVISGDGAISIKEGTVYLTKGTAAAITLAAPTAGLPSAGGDDGKELRVITTTAAAHVITSSVDGFNAKGSSGTATFTAAIGNAVTFSAYNGHWYSEDKLNVTIA